MNRQRVERTRRVALLVCALLAPALLSADTFHFDGVTGTGWGGYYVSPYLATNTTSHESLLLYCIDFNNYAVSNWTANVISLSLGGEFKYSHSNIPSFMYEDGYNVDGSPVLPILDRYLAAAYLFSQNASDGRTRAVYQYAAWELLLKDTSASRFNTALNSIVSTVSERTFQQDVSAALADAVANRASVDRTAWAVVTPTNPATSQEFLTRVPEPFEAVTLGLGVLGVGLFWRKRVRAA